MDVDVPARIRLLKGPPFSREFQNLLHKFQWTEFKNVFRDSLLSNDGSQINIPTNSSSVLDEPDVGKTSHASLLPWTFSGKNEGHRHAQHIPLVTTDNRTPSSNNSAAHHELQYGVDARSNEEFVSREAAQGNQPDDREIVGALVSATRQILDRTPRALDFGAVKAQAEQLYGLRPDFWGTSEKDKWFLRSKNVIKWAVVSQFIMSICED